MLLRAKSEFRAVALLHDLRGLIPAGLYRPLVPKFYDPVPFGTWAIDEFSEKLTGRCWAPGDFGQELIIGLSGLEFVDQELEAGRFATLGGETIQYPAKFPYLGQNVAGEEQFLVPG